MKVYKDDYGRLYTEVKGAWRAFSPGRERPDGVYSMDKGSVVHMGDASALTPMEGDGRFSFLNDGSLFDALRAFQRYGVKTAEEADVSFGQARRQET